MVNIKQSIPELAQTNGYNFSKTNIPVMSKKQVTFQFLCEKDYEYTVVANVIFGASAPPQNFARFQEPDDPDEVEILSITYESGEQFEFESFSESDQNRMEEMALEQADEYDDF